MIFPIIQGECINVLAKISSKNIENAPFVSRWTSSQKSFTSKYTSLRSFIRLCAKCFWPLGEKCFGCFAKTAFHVSKERTWRRLPQKNCSFSYILDLQLEMFGHLAIILRGFVENGLHMSRKTFWRRKRKMFSLEKFVCHLFRILSEIFSSFRQKPSAGLSKVHSTCPAETLDTFPWIIYTSYIVSRHWAKNCRPLTKKLSACSWKLHSTCPGETFLENEKNHFVDKKFVILLG